MPREFHVHFDIPLPTYEPYTMYNDYNTDSLPAQYSPSASSNKSNTSFFGNMPPSPTGPAASGWNAPMPRINLAGSWLDLDSDNEDEPTQAVQLTRRPRKRSPSPARESSRNTLSSLKDKLLSRRSSMHFLKLTSRPSS
ncbi:hypothetical protein IWW48_004302 [Coemansia sp. RSA 1200]|nr:hypothetical protein IWW48_004302 [Coemansia sp. RSA 1200]